MSNPEIKISTKPPNHNYRLTKGDICQAFMIYLLGKQVTYCSACLLAPKSTEI